jgi:hypothetical protein
MNSSQANINSAQKRRLEEILNSDNNQKSLKKNKKNEDIYETNKNESLINDTNSDDKEKYPIVAENASYQTISEEGWLDICNKYVIPFISSMNEIYKLSLLSKYFFKGILLKKVYISYEKYIPYQNCNYSIIRNREIDTVIISGLNLNSQQLMIQEDCLNFLSVLKESPTTLIFVGPLNLKNHIYISESDCAIPPILSQNDYDTLSSLTKLKTVGIYGYSIKHSNDKFIRIINNIPNISHLDMWSYYNSGVENIIQNNGITRISIRVYSSPNKDFISFHFPILTKFADSVKELVIDFSDRSKTFHYSGSDGDDDDDDEEYDETYIEQLENSFETLTNLEVLMIRNTTIRDNYCCEIIKMIESIPNIKKLFFINCDIKHRKFLCSLNLEKVSIQKIQFVNCSFITEKDIIEAFTIGKIVIENYNCSKIRKSFYQFFCKNIRPSLLQLYNERIKENIVSDLNFRKFFNGIQEGNYIEHVKANLSTLTDVLLVYLKLKNINEFIKERVFYTNNDKEQFLGLLGSNDIPARILIGNTYHNIKELK